MTGVLFFSLFTVCFMGYLSFSAVVRDIFRPPSADLIAAAASQSIFPWWGAFAAAFSFPAVLVSISFLSAAVPIVIGFVMVHFAKTQSSECLYFTLFLLACLTETTRLFIPFFDLWVNNSSMLITSVRILFFGRLMAPLSFLFSSIFTMEGQTQGAERNSAFLFAVAGIIALLVPVNTTRILPNCTVEIGFTAFFWIYECVLAALTFISLLIQAKSSGPPGRILALGFLFLFLGYIILLGTQTIAALCLGMLCFSLGVYLYLVNLHKIYL